MEMRKIDQVVVKAERLIRKCQKDFTAHLTLLMFTDRTAGELLNVAEQERQEIQVKMDRISNHYNLVEGSLIIDYVKVAYFPYYSFFVRIPSWVRLTYPEFY